MTWGQNEWLWLIGIVIAVVGIVIGFAVARRYGTRRRRLLFTWDAVQLMPGTGLAPGVLQVSYSGVPVTDPYLVQITLKNIGPADIASADFDDKRNLRISFPNGYLTMVSAHSSGVTPSILCSPNCIEIAPVLLRRQSSISLDVLVDGPPKIDPLSSPLVNTDVVKVDAAARAQALLDQSGDPIGLAIGLVRLLIEGRSR
ncbi:hypothetical protein ACFC25_10630 [Pseudarthrobacter sp. NPDC055928]|uniref:hypothetical protein n=1 Tax=Pseudarthrobacter sp. NPDC055928 TaxID=3345661 RepID=UPI0035E2F468